LRSAGANGLKTTSNFFLSFVILANIPNKAFPMTDHQSVPHGGSIRLDDLIALNREIAALVRSGIPLELGLRGFSGGLPYRLNRLTERIANRLGNGMSLVEAIEQEGSGLSPIYAAIVGAGLQSGRLADAVESVAFSAETMNDMRRRVRLAMVYPAALAWLGYLLFTGFVFLVVPRYVDIADSFGFGQDEVFRLMRVIHETAPLWAVWIPAGLFFVALVGTPVYRLVRGRYSPWGMSRTLALTQFLELLRLQVSHHLPLPAAFRRAALATEQSMLREAALHLAGELQRGRSFADVLAETVVFPPLMRWMLASGEQQGTLAETLGLLSDSYRRKAIQRANFLKFWLPMIITIGVSGIITLLYSLLFFVPLRALWDGLIRE
jgi:type II secretory pathway component PulF